MAFKVINNSIGLDGLIPILLVFGAYPWMIESDVLLPTVTQCVIACYITIGKGALDSII